MLSYKSRENLRKEFVDFNKRFSTPAYPNIVEKNKDKDNVKPPPIFIPQQNNLPTVVKEFTPTAEIVVAKKVYYSGKKNLSKDNNKLLDIDKEVDLCVYCIAKVNIKPFLLFSLFKNDVNGGDLSWPTINVKNKPIGDIIKLLKTKIKDSNKSITYEGIYKYNKRNQLWFSCEDITDNVLLGKYNDTQFWASSYEIVNYKKLLTFSINKDVTKFFLENNDFLYLKNNLGVIYETPLIGYYGNHANCITFVANMGILRADTTMSFGPHYYYGNYIKAIELSIKSDNDDRSLKVPSYIDDVNLINKQGQFTKGGLMRSAIFSRNIIMPNFTNKKLFDDDKWTSHGDCVIKSLGNNSENLQVVYVIKNFEQQYPLEYYYITTTSKAAVEKNYSDVKID